MDLKKVKNKSTDGVARLLGLLTSKEEVAEVKDSADTYQSKLKDLIEDIDVVEGVDMSISAEELGLEEFNESIVEDIKSIVMDKVNTDVDEEDFEGNNTQCEVSSLDPQTIKIEAWYNV